MKYALGAIVLSLILGAWFMLSTFDGGDHAELHRVESREELSSLSEVRRASYETPDYAPPENGDSAEHDAETEVPQSSPDDPPPGTFDAPAWGSLRARIIATGTGPISGLVAYLESRGQASLASSGNVEEAEGPVDDAVESVPPASAPPQPEGDSSGAISSAEKESLPEISTSTSMRSQVAEIDPEGRIMDPLEVEMTHSLVIKDPFGAEVYRRDGIRIWPDAVTDLGVIEICTHYLRVELDFEFPEHALRCSGTVFVRQVDESDDNLRFFGITLEEKTKLVFYVPRLPVEIVPDFNGIRRLAYPLDRPEATIVLEDGIRRCVSLGLQGLLEADYNLAVDFILDDARGGSCRATLDRDGGQSEIILPDYGNYIVHLILWHRRRRYSSATTTHKDCFIEKEVKVTRNDTSVIELHLSAEGEQILREKGALR